MHILHHRGSGAIDRWTFHMSEKARRPLRSDEAHHDDGVRCAVRRTKAMNMLAIVIAEPYDPTGRFLCLPMQLRSGLDAPLERELLDRWNAVI
jgi:hypothetical protein